MAVTPRFSKGNISYEVRIINKKLLEPLGFAKGFYSFTVSTEAEANREFAAITADLKRGHIPEFILSASKAKLSTKMTVNDVWRLMHSDINYIISRSTADIMNTLLDSVGHIVVAEFDKQAMMIWLGELKKANLAPGTIRKKVGAMASIFHYAAISDEINLPTNIFTHLPKNYSHYAASVDRRDKHVKRDIKRQRRLNDNEYKLILEGIQNLSIDPRMKRIEGEFKDAWTLFFEMAINTGMRSQEMFLLKWENLAFGTEEQKVGIINIPEDNTKSDTTRQAPMNSLLYEMLLDYRKKFPKPAEAEIFPFFEYYEFSRKKCSTAISHMWARMMLSLGIQGLRLHDLRHEGVSRLVERSTFTLPQLMKITGHIDSRTFHRYNNLRIEDVANSKY